MHGHAYSLQLQQRLVALLADRGVRAEGGTEDRGAFVMVRDARAVMWADQLAQRRVRSDARGEFLRLCPDVLTTDQELETAAEELGALANTTR